jgi:hypothetical protein
MGLITALPTIQLAAKWYKRQNDTTKLEWCHRAMERLEIYGLRAPDLGIGVVEPPPTTQPSAKSRAVKANTKAKRTQDTHQC